MNAEIVNIALQSGQKMPARLIETPLLGVSPQHRRRILLWVGCDGDKLHGRVIGYLLLDHMHAPRHLFATHRAGSEDHIGNPNLAEQVGERDWLGELIRKGEVWNR